MADRSAILTNARQLLADLPYDAIVALADLLGMVAVDELKRVGLPRAADLLPDWFDAPPAAHVLTTVNGKGVKDAAVMVTFPHVLTAPPDVTDAQVKRARQNARKV